MTSTKNLNITLVETSQAQKEVTVNEAIARIDAILNTGAKDKDLSAPPASPVAGDVYIVASSPTGAWATHANHIAYFDQAWKFITPNEGMRLWVNDENKIYAYDGAGWAVYGVGKYSLYIPASDIFPSAASGSAALATASLGAGMPTIQHLAFDASVSESAEFTITMPKRWNNGGGTVVIDWSHAATTTNFGVVWNIQVMAMGDGDHMATAYSSATSITDTGGATDRLYKTTESSFFTVTNSPSALDTLYFRILRDATHASDTLAIDARLHGITLNFYSASLTDD
jgi:hypothetical protein